MTSYQPTPDSAPFLARDLERVLTLGQVLGRLEVLDGIPLIEAELTRLRAALLEASLPAVTIAGGRAADVAGDGPPAYFERDLVDGTLRQLGPADWVELLERLGAPMGELLQVIVTRHPEAVR